MTKQNYLRHFNISIILALLTRFVPNHAPILFYFSHSQFPPNGYFFLSYFFFFVQPSMLGTKSSVEFSIHAYSRIRKCFHNLIDINTCKLNLKTFMSTFAFLHTHSVPSMSFDRRRVRHTQNLNKKIMPSRRTLISYSHFSAILLALSAFYLRKCFNLDLCYRKLISSL